MENSFKAFKLPFVTQNLFQKRVMLQGCDQWRHSLISDLLIFNYFTYVAEETGKLKTKSQFVTFWPHIWGWKGPNKYLLDVNIDLQLLI